MTDSNEEVLRKSLDAVDRHRTRLLIGLAAGVVLLFLTFYGVASSIHAHPSTNNFVHGMFIILAVWTPLLALVVVNQITVMTKRILRAIELSSRK